MNTRLQVEHPVTELVTGLDLVAWQLLIAEGERLPLTQAQVQLRGHAIEARLYAEDPYAGFAPQTGRVTRFHVSQALAQPGVRVDSGIADGSEITPYYDAMLAKLIVHGGTRAQATRKLIRALEDAPLFGLTTNARFLIDLLHTPEFERVELATTTLDGWLEQDAELFQRPDVPAQVWALACALLLEHAGDGFRSSGAGSGFELTLACRAERRSLRVTQRAGVISDKSIDVQVADITIRVEALSRTADLCSAEVDGVRKRFFGFSHAGRVQLSLAGQCFELSEPSPLESKTSAGDPSRVRSPLAGKVARVLVEPGSAVETGAPLLVIEAMKMETRVLAAGSGKLRELHCAVGDQVAAGDFLASIELTQEST
jgi:geranyl-CoA carboxylase alpha subunit